MDTGPQTYVAYHRLQTELTILGRLIEEKSKHCKVDSTGRIMAVQDSSQMWTSFNRWMSGDSRDHLLSRVESLFHETSQFLSLLATNRILKEYDNPARVHWVRDIDALCDCAQNASKGLHSLRQTYKSSVEMDTKLQSLQDMISRSIAPIRAEIEIDSPMLSATSTRTPPSEMSFALNADADTYRDTDSLP